MTKPRHLTAQTLPLLSVDYLLNFYCGTKTHIFFDQNVLQQFIR